MANTTVTGAQAIHGQNPQVDMPRGYKASLTFLVLS